MSQELDRAGTFRGTIVDYGIYEAQSGSLMVNLTANIDGYWNGSEWEDWRDYQFVARGAINVIKKNGETNDIGVSSLVRFAKWDGTFASIESQSWKPSQCSFVVKEDNFNGATKYKIDSVGDYERASGGGGNVDASKAKLFDTRFGSAIRAIASTAKRNSEPPSGKAMPTPKKSSSAGPLPPRGEPAPNDEIPF